MTRPQPAPAAIAQAIAVREAEIFDSVWALSSWMFENPETAYEEHRASRRAADMLSSTGFDVTNPAYGLDTAFAARTGSDDGPHVVICAEYDALPGLGHACGHNLIAASAIGAGHALFPVADDLGIRLTILGTPAEEGAGGKIEMLRAGAFTDTDAVMMIHPGPDDVIDPGFLAVAHLVVDYTGKEAHAAQAPAGAVNALDATVLAYSAISMLRQQIPASCRVHGVILDGGQAPNVIPGHSRSEWGVRAPGHNALSELRARVENCFAAAAQATGCRHEVRDKGPVYEGLVSDPDLADEFSAVAGGLGRHMRQALDHEVHGSSDIGNVSMAAKTIHPLLRLGNDVPNHDPRFALLTISDEGRRLIHDGITALAFTTARFAQRRRGSV